MYHKGALVLYFIHIVQIKVVVVSIRYRTEVYTKDLDSPNSDWVTMPELPDSRMWHGCVVAEVDGVRGQPSPILVCLSLSSIVYTAIPSRP